MLINSLLIKKNVYSHPYFTYPEIVESRSNFPHARDRGIGELQLVQLRQITSEIAHRRFCCGADLDFQTTDGAVKDFEAIDEQEEEIEEKERRRRDEEEREKEEDFEEEREEEEEADEEE